MNYTPRLIDDINLFDLKKRFVYVVFKNTLLADKRKSLVRQHEGDYNAHDIHRELLAHMSIIYLSYVYLFLTYIYIK